MLERCEAKVSRTVLKGLGAGNGIRLLDCWRRMNNSPEEIKSMTKGRLRNKIRLFSRLGHI